ncbi:hypothetical protein LTR82_011303 [Friedmanniomyces endolithicus]|uniref:Peptidase A1 domain-containing protein n=1 Tax=Friedmanniomyces endolithicus TaxID=329885 RepID=A0AAN6J616_9PEZI|nr:hypothetical protein LTR82_011303 [Friedmanniomyces endolithicus]
MAEVFFSDWKLWEKLCFALACAIVVTVLLGALKLGYIHWRLRKYTGIAEKEKREQAIQRQMSQRRRHDAVPFGIRALESGIETEGVWVSRPNTPECHSRESSAGSLMLKQYPRSFEDADIEKQFPRIHQKARSRSPAIPGTRLSAHFGRTASEDRVATCRASRNDSPDAAIIPQNDGLLGLGFSTINTIQPQRQKTFFENIMPSLALPVFTANLQADASGTYTFGAIDTAQYSGPIHYTPIDSSAGFWQFTSPSYTIGSNGASVPCTTCSPAIADTGTSLVLLDDDVVSAYYAQVNGASQDQSQGGWVFPCSASLPGFGVAIGSGYTAMLTGQDVMYESLGGGVCYGGLQSNAGQGVQIFGDVLLRHYFAVFDGGAKRFGLAKKA